MNELARRVKDASIKLAGAGGELKNRALEEIAEALMKRKDQIIEANREDLIRSDRETG